MLKGARQYCPAVLMGEPDTNPRSCTLLVFPRYIRGERRKEELYAFSEEELRPYFALPEVLTIRSTFFERVTEESRVARVFIFCDRSAERHSTHAQINRSLYPGRYR